MQERLHIKTNEFGKNSLIKNFQNVHMDMINSHKRIKCKIDDERKYSTYIKMILCVCTHGRILKFLKKGIVKNIYTFQYNRIVLSLSQIVFIPEQFLISRIQTGVEIRFSSPGYWCLYTIHTLKIPGHVCAAS